jgi:hypothetical protein
MTKISLQAAAGTIDGTEKLAGAKHNGTIWESKSILISAIVALTRNGVSAAELAHLIGASDNIQDQIDINTLDIDDLWLEIAGIGAGKQNVAWNPIPGGAGAGNNIAFDIPKVIGTTATPVTGNVSANLTGAVVGVMLRMIHNQGSAPSFDAGTLQAASDSVAYVNGVNNYIEFQYWGGTKARYKITQ